MFPQPRPSCRRGIYHLEDTIAHWRTILAGWSVPKSLRQHNGFKRSRQPCEPLQQQNRQSKTQGRCCTSFWRLAKSYTDLVSRSPIVGWSHPSGCGTPSWLVHLPSTHMRLWRSNQRPGFTWLACKKSTQRHIRHSMLNDILWRAVKKALVPACKEPVSLSRIDSKRPDGATLVPWACGKPMALGCNSARHIRTVSRQRHFHSSRNSCRQRSRRQEGKYTDIANTHMFISVAIETGWPWNVEAIELIQEIWRRITLINGESRETEYLFQRISFPVKRATIWPTRAPFKPNPIFNPKEDRVKQASYLI